ncbi:hypothetical protein BUALT_Bualt04G0083100 [Buddleja alternifolia]|uniref:CRM domain-containing protein n=1 Tax=Buddleja alternifolia TaxID=168488 RepID=A0AAV6XTS1_9LAMI|nr:hypothetical protein BUALT_Bualt04G0083100 [Buddleja alternifolia]
MSASPFLSHVSNAITPFPYNLSKVPIPSKFSFSNFSNPPTNYNISTKIEGRSIEFESQEYKTKSCSETISHSGSAIKAPTAPWMNEPLLVEPNEMMEFKKPKTKKDSIFSRNEEHPDNDLTGKVGGGRGKVAMKKIFKGIEKLQETENLDETRKNPKNIKFKFAPGDLWGDGGYQNDEENSGVAQEILENNEFDIPLADIENEGKLKKLPWQRDERMVVRRVKKEKAVTAAELSLDGILLERLRGEAATIRQWVKVKKAGVTQAVVDQVHCIWRDDELALIKFDLPLCRNMDRAREIVEMKTRGVVVWSNKDFLAVYRGCNYLSGSKHIWKRNHNSSGDQQNSSFIPNYENTKVRSDGSSLDEVIHGKDGKWESLHTSSLYEREADRLLDGLGPRFVDWWMSKPLPVDADLLPEVVPGLMTPLRICPPYTKSKLTDDELTQLRKLARPLPTHFVLGRNRNLQGLAAAILKLWEKCHIAKIALKWGIPNTDNEQMANELKASDLTGGVLLLRNKFLIILYRGKDFVPSQVANVVAEREMELTRCQLHEEAARLKGSETFSITDDHLLNSGIVGTLSEFYSIQSKSSGFLKKENTEAEVKLEVEQERLEKELKDEERKLYILKKKIEKSAKVLDKLKDAARFAEQDADLEIISEEERVCLRRRGVYDGVIEGMHQHWKHREIVKVITMQKKLSQVMFTGKCLEAESGGIVVSIDKLKEGHAIIVYRGKNYKRPKLAPQNLLNKREALSRSLEIQRIGSMKFFANQKEQAICDLKRKLAELSEKKN